MKSENKKKVGRPFTKGNKFGKGRPPLTKEEKEVMKLARHEVTKVISKYFGFNREEVREVMANPQTVMLDAMVLSVMSHALKKGDEKRLNWLLEQVVGKVKDKVEITGHNNTPFNNSIEVVFTKTNETDEED